MGGAQPLAATMAGASMLAVECQPSRIEMRLKTGYLDTQADDLDEALAMIERSCRERKPLSVGLLGNAAEIFPELVRRGVRPDVVTDQTSAHDPLNGYLPKGWTLAEWEQASRERSEGGRDGREAFDGRACPRHARLSQAWACRRSTTATTSARWRRRRGSRTPSTFPASCRPTSARSSAAASGRSAGRRSPAIRRTSTAPTQRVKELLPDNKHLHHWLDMARARIKFQGLPARICWVGLGDRHRLGLAFNEMVAKGELKAPIVIGRDHLDSGSVASPNRETEAMRDGSDAVSDWPLLNALLNCASGATWVSLHHGGGVGMGFSQHAGMVIVADGTPEAAQAASSACCGTIRPPASCATPMPATRSPIESAREHGLDLPGILGA